MDLNAIASKTATTEVPFLGETVRLDYRPALLTRDRLAALDAENVDEDTAATFLCDVLAGWDLTNDGEPLPITVEGLGKVPFPLLKEMMKGLVEGTKPGEADGLSNAG